MEKFKYYQHLGFNNPYFIKDEVPFIIKRRFSDILKDFDSVLKIDSASVIEMLSKNYFFADRTILQGISRTPWQAKPNDSFTKWKFNQPPAHDKKIITEEEIAIKLFEKICNEIEDYIGNKKNVGVLLSGGMDSRMVAGSIDYLIKNKRVNDLNIIGLTWGNEGSRDVMYAQEITRRLGWKWKQYTVDTNSLRGNIKETVENGCEYSPIHLHAIPQIRDDNTLDVILAGSYGDSVGRAEYGGRNVTVLAPIDKTIRNFGGIINDKVYKTVRQDIKKDIQFYHSLFPAKEKYMQNELDYELHFMRRMLNPCMELLTENSEFYQVFTSPEVYGYMWSIDPQKRNDMVYYHMMKEFKTDLSDIPWARTGLPYMSKGGVPDNYSSQHHSYIDIINYEMLDELREIIFSGNLEQTGIFDMSNVYHLVKLIKKYPLNHIHFVEKILWLASLSLLLEKNDIVKNSTDNIASKNKSINRKTWLLYGEYLFVKYR